MNTSLNTPPAELYKGGDIIHIYKSKHSIWYHILVFHAEYK